MSTSGSGMLIQAYDVGYGWVKYTTAGRSDGARIECDSFESISIPSRTGNIGAGVMERHDVFDVEVGGKRYTVGKDVRLAASANDAGDVLIDDFALTDEHMARLYGAMSYVNTRAHNTIDWAVLGLPLTTYEAKSEALEKRVVGRHVINTKGVTVEIRAARVFPQPLGAWFEHGMANADNLKALRDQTTLVVDVGENTVDWLLCEGMKPVRQRSGAERRGMAHFLHEVALSIKDRNRFEIEPKKIVDVIEKALSRGQPVTLFNQVILIDEYVEQASIVVDQAVKRMMAKVGDSADINNILITGGGAAFYRRAVQAAFPRHSLIEVDEPRYANVRGFQIIGEKWASSARRAEAASQI